MVQRRSVEILLLKSEEDLRNAPHKASTYSIKDLKRFYFY